MSLIDTTTDVADRESHAYELLREQILSGKLAPGAPLSQNRVAKELGVSRTPVRSALQRLRSDGLVTAKEENSAKLIVADMSAEELEILYQTLGVLEGLAARLAARRLTALSAAMLESALEEERRIADGSEPLADPLEQLATIHRLIVESLDSPALSAAIEAIRLPLNRYRRIFLKPKGFSGASLEFHEKIVAAIVGGNGAEAERLMIEHLADSFAEIVGALRKDGRLGGRKSLSRLRG